MLRKLGSDWNVFRITPLDQADTVHISLTVCKNEFTLRYVNIGYYIVRYSCTYTEHQNGDEVEATSFTTFEKVAGSF